MVKKLEKDIRGKKTPVAVIGLGYVGLPLALSFARKGFKVFGIDNDKDRVRKLLAGMSYITDVTDKEITVPVRARTFIPTTDFRVIRESRVVLICVPTPIRRQYTPDISFILSAVRAVRANMASGTLVVLESTTYPGTTEELIRSELEKGGLIVGKDVFLAFSPERVDPGNVKHVVTKIPKIVGGVTPACGRLTKMLYQVIIRHVHVVSSPRAAEMTKLLENTFRIVNIGWINEAALMCHRFGIDIWEVIEAAKTKPFGFMPFYPGLGVGGHCIPEDPIYLYWKARQKGYASRFIKLAADINSAMPDHVVARLTTILQERGKKLSGSKVLVLGVTYKKGVKDLRKSPSIKLIGILKSKGAKVSFYDPLVPYLDIEDVKMQGVKLAPKTVAAHDMVVVAVDHTAVDYSMVRRNAKIIFDARNVYGGKKFDNIVVL